MLCSLAEASAGQMAVAGHPPILSNVAKGTQRNKKR